MKENVIGDQLQQARLDAIEIAAIQEQYDKNMDQMANLEKDADFDTDVST